MPNDVSKALAVLSHSIQSCNDYAWAWHCNIAMPMIDEGIEPRTANIAASKIMRLLFDVDVTKFNQWKIEESYENV